MRKREAPRVADVGSLPRVREKEEIACDLGFHAIPATIGNPGEQPRLRLSESVAQRNLAFGKNDAWSLGNTGDTIAPDPDFLLVGGLLHVRVQRIGNAGAREAVL
jgi:hypothetical protein